MGALELTKLDRNRSTLTSQWQTVGSRFSIRSSYICRRSLQRADSDLFVGFSSEPAIDRRGKDVRLGAMRFVVQTRGLAPVFRRASAKYPWLAQDTCQRQDHSPFNVARIRQRLSHKPTKSLTLLHGILLR
jgi:hypothetical protein